MIYTDPSGEFIFTAVEYLDKMGKEGMISGGISFSGSLIDYSTWDRFETTEKTDKLRRKFGENIQFDDKTNDYGSY